MFNNDLMIVRIFHENNLAFEKEINKTNLHPYIFVVDDRKYFIVIHFFEKFISFFCKLFDVQSSNVSSKCVYLCDKNRKQLCIFILIFSSRALCTKMTELLTPVNTYVIYVIMYIHTGIYLFVFNSEPRWKENGNT